MGGAVHHDIAGHLVAGGLIGSIRDLTDRHEAQVAHREIVLLILDVILGKLAERTERLGWIDRSFAEGFCFARQQWVERHLATHVHAATRSLHQFKADGFGLLGASFRFAFIRVGAVGWPDDELGSGLVSEMFEQEG